ncbi:uncharacterized protein PHACADRAFT_185751 [Phanerochaete carnosa HHB-10118-sp]|uniref:Uncharacterized protein n=1 Tax=Phanerochaete carnosa (strain HHB-10118-sp) TaxID=650164 RepID=K5USM4_PHACS|nr:uncharacterized protein PHACADRAFT_185751 [Phanerochaete carnosa HHB-10118-sp]EKM52921.1 hypothetical protein PHACADRAFT_185751 [Phanerochaete carnosa HHB-10118-sp]
MFEFLKQIPNVVSRTDGVSNRPSSSPSIIRRQPASVVLPDDGMVFLNEDKTSLAPISEEEREKLGTTASIVDCTDGVPKRSPSFSSRHKPASVSSRDHGTAADSDTSIVGYTDVVSRSSFFPHPARCQPAPMAPGARFGISAYPDGGTDDIPMAGIPLIDIRSTADVSSGESPSRSRVADGAGQNNAVFSTDYGGPDFESKSTEESSSKEWLVMVVEYVEQMRLQQWVSIHGSPLPQPIPLLRDEPFRIQFSRDMRPCWATDAYFWLAFIPRDVAFEGRLFESLQSPFPLITSQVRLPNGHTGQRTSLSEQARYKWSQLEFVLGQLRGLLTRMAGTLPLGLESPPSPSEYGYEHYFSDRKSAYYALEKAQWAFLLHMAYISCLGCMNPSLIDSLNLTGSVWKHVPDEAKIALQLSWIFSKYKTVPRVGAFVDTTLSGQWLHHFDAISAVPGLPLWLHYPEDPSVPLAHQTFKLHAPTKEQIADALENPETYHRILSSREAYGASYSSIPRSVGTSPHTPKGAPESDREYTHPSSDIPFLVASPLVRIKTEAVPLVAAGIETEVDLPVAVILLALRTRVKAALFDSLGPLTNLEGNTRYIPLLIAGSIETNRLPSARSLVAHLRVQVALIESDSSLRSGRGSQI